MNKKSLSDIFSHVLGINKRLLTQKSSPETITEWDSVNNLILISEIEKEYDVVITIDDVYQLKTFGDVYNFIKNKGVDIKM